MSLHHQHLYIGGQWVKPASSKRFEVVDASTEEPIGSAPEGVQADIDRAVAPARAALTDSTWSKTTPAERGAL